GRWYERTAHGHESAWGDVLDWEPPRRLVLGWQITPEGQPEPDPTRASEVEVTFISADGSETRVVVRHRAFNRHGPEGGAIWRQAMDSSEGWPKFLDRYARFVSNS
ncbi:MAG TPA: SRPBCC domain-containing protein, partial [Thermomicrobiales bacterium]|nr:SRPBCC domain-containing protein [Thermomicrobiales bacterium]